ncbi:MAG: hypothetical protein CJBNEKGG_02520 [Prosthecobacter sp.]|nr:hypothetical protein [Prosthecobacter sp.]
MIPVTVITEVIIQERHCPRSWHATLPNGRKVIAFRTQHEPTLQLSPGDKAQAELSVGDFSQAHLIG